MASQKKLGIFLEEGFANDTVTVLVNQKKVFHQTGITSKDIRDAAKEMNDKIRNAAEATEVLESIFKFAIPVELDSTADQCTHFGDYTLVFPKIYLIVK